MDFKEDIKKYIEAEQKVVESLNLDELNAGLCEIVEAYNREGTIYIFGNGGSASTASHFVNDFNKGVSEKLEKKFKFVCLNDNVSTLMAVANDIGYEEVFRFQLLNKLEKKDLVIGISGSGNSANVVNALSYAKECGVRTLGLTGYSGGKVRNMVDVSMHVPVDNMQVTEDLHMMFDHMMMSVLKEKLK